MRRTKLLLNERPSCTKHSRMCTLLFPNERLCKLVERSEHQVLIFRCCCCCCGNSCAVSMSMPIADAIQVPQPEITSKSACGSTPPSHDSCISPNPESFLLRIARAARRRSALAHYFNAAALFYLVDDRRSVRYSGPLSVAGGSSADPIDRLSVSCDDVEVLAAIFASAACRAAAAAANRPALERSSRLRSGAPLPPPPPELEPPEP